MNQRLFVKREYLVLQIYTTCTNQEKKCKKKHVETEDNKNEKKDIL